MKKLFSHFISLFFVLFCSVAAIQCMEVTDVKNNINLDTLIPELLNKIGFCLDGQNMVSMRYINMRCKQKIASQEELNKLFCGAVLKAIKEDDASDLHFWKNFVVPAKLFLNFLVNGEDKFARIVYSECHFDANGMLDTAAKYGNIHGAQLVIENYYANDTNRALRRAIVLGFNDLANMLIGKKASPTYICMEAAKNADEKLYNSTIALYSPSEDQLGKIIESAIKGCLHSHSEECGHKNIIKSLIEADGIHTNMQQQALLFGVKLGCMGMIMWLIDQYTFEEQIIREAITEAEKRGYQEIVSLLEYLVASCL